MTLPTCWTLKFGNKPYHIGDSRQLIKELPDKCVDFIMTSPPYYNEKEYAHWDSFNDYLKDMTGIYTECERILKDGCRIAVNVGDIYSKTGEIIPLIAHTELALFSTKLLKDTSIVWDKSLKGAKNTAWGSFCMPSNPCIQSYHEMILVFKKVGVRNIADKEYRLDKKFFFENIQSVWHFKQETKDVGHPAPYPPELPRRAIKMWTYPGEVVFDPFIGSGTNLLVCRELRREGIGFEINPEFEPVLIDRSMMLIKSLEDY